MNICNWNLLRYFECEVIYRLYSKVRNILFKDRKSKVTWNREIVLAWSREKAKRELRKNKKNAFGKCVVAREKEKPWYKLLGLMSPDRNTILSNPTPQSYIFNLTINNSETIYFFKILTLKRRSYSFGKKKFLNLNKIFFSYKKKSLL